MTLVYKSFANFAKFFFVCLTKTLLSVEAGKMELVRSWINIIRKKRPIPECSINYAANMIRTKALDT